MNNVFFNKFYDITKDILKIMGIESHDLYVKAGEIEIRYLIDGKYFVLKVQEYQLSKCKAMNVAVNFKDGTSCKVVYLKTDLDTGKHTDASIKDKGEYFNMSIEKNMVFSFDELEKLREYFHTLNDEISIAFEGQVWNHYER